MAAGGFKEFVAGETLDQDEINDYLMQGVLVFAGTAARGSAITSPVEGQFSFLKDSDTLEFYDGTAWVGLTSTLDVEYLVIGGGGSGGWGPGGGGGAGGYLTGTTPIIPEKAYGITIGAGGLTASISSPLVNGNVSSCLGIIASGGGAGAYSSTAANNGGSGGGGTSGAAAGTGISGQGNNGGSGAAPAGFGKSGGGGGAGAVGQDAAVSSSLDGGDGGNGLSSSITGSAVTRAGGGGGGIDSRNGGAAGTGGTGGGGNGGANATGSAGTVNTGGGGGGGGYQNLAPGAGGSGIVVLKYADSLSPTFGAGLTTSTTTSGGFKITTITAGTDTVTF